MELVFRPLESADLQSWVPSFNCGSDDACAEVDHWLQTGAWDGHRVGNSFTTIFSDASTLATPLGFLTLAAMTMTLKQLGEDPPSDLRRAVINLLYVGVDHRFQGDGVGAGMLACLERQLQEGPLSARYIVLDVRKGNRAAKLYKRVGFNDFGGEKISPYGHDPGRQAPLQRMILDRFT